MQAEFIVFLVIGVVAALIPSMDTQCECLQNIHLRRGGLVIRLAPVVAQQPLTDLKENKKRYYLRGSY